MKKKMLKLKSILTVTLACLMVISMVGCGQKEEVQSGEVEETGVEETVDTTDLGSANAASTNGTYEEYVYSLNLQIPSAYGVDASYLAENGPDNNALSGIDFNCMADQLIQYLYGAYQEGESNPFVFASDYDDTVSLIKAFPNRDTTTDDEDLAHAIDQVLEMDDTKIWISYGLNWNYLENGKELYITDAAYYGKIEIIVSSIQDGQRDSVKYTIHYDQQGITEVETE